MKGVFKKVRNWWKASSRRTKVLIGTGTTIVVILVISTIANN